MRNKKNGGKRVRTPIVTPPPANKTKEVKEKKESKVTTLLFLGAIAVAATLALAVGTIFLVRGDITANELNKKEVVQKPATAEQVLDAVYISLFTYGLDKNNIKEKTEVVSDNDTELKLTIDSADIEEIELKQTLIEKLAEIKMNITSEDTLIATNSIVKIIIGFAAEQPAEIKPNSIAFVIDDCGYNLELAKQLAELPYPITMAIIPHTKYASETAKLAKKYGKTVFLHQPMQPESYPKTDPGKGAVLLSMSEKQINNAIEGNMKDIDAKIDGFNNHMGSALTKSSEKMKLVFSAMGKYTHTFVDSYTSKETVAYDECLKAGFKCGMNRKFIDNESDYGYIRSKIIEGTAIAREDGSVIMIGHLREGTVHALSKILPDLEKAGYPIVSSLELAHK